MKKDTETGKIRQEHRDMRNFLAMIYLHGYPRERLGQTTPQMILDLENLLKEVPVR